MLGLFDGDGPSTKIRLSVNDLFHLRYARNTNMLIISTSFTTTPEVVSETDIQHHGRMESHSAIDRKADLHDCDIKVRVHLARNTQGK